MPATVIVGLQWGDEGKGKTTDFLAEQTAMVVRYQGGDNAGHTVVVGDETVKLQLCPSGVLYPHITSVIGNGVVVNPATLIRELDMLIARGVDVAKVRVSRSAHVIMPYHVALDQGQRDAPRGREGRARPAAASGRRTATAPGAWASGWRTSSTSPSCASASPAPSWTRTCCSRRMGVDTFEVEPLVAQCLAWGERLRPHLDDSTWLVQDALRRGDHVLLEGAQGTLLDLDHGSYPFVTSSNPVAGGACTGGGVGPLQVDEVIGVMKAYATRVGSGPFPTELFDEIGHGIAERGREFGTVTGRAAPRRLVRHRPAALRGRGQLQLRHRAQQARHPVRASRRSSCASPTRSTAGASRPGRRPARALGRATPIYEDFEGWEEPIHDVRSLADLPEAARRYVTALEEHAGVPIVFVSVGPERTQTIERAWRPMRHRPTKPA